MTKENEGREGFVSFKLIPNGWKTHPTGFQAYVSSRLLESNESEEKKEKLEKFKEILNELSLGEGFQSRYGSNSMIRRVFSEDGGEIEDFELLIPGETLIFSEGEEFKSKTADQRFHLIQKKRTKQRRDRWIVLNVGGTLFNTTKSTLTMIPNSFFCKMLESDDFVGRDSEGSYFIDQSPQYFSAILSYLRLGRVILDNKRNPEGILSLAKYFELWDLVEQLQVIVDGKKREDHHLNRKEICQRLMTTTSSQGVLRGQGLDLQKTDLSKLDLSRINFIMSNFAGATLVKTLLDESNLQMANLSFCEMQDASLRGCNLSRANMEGANLDHANFEDIRGIKTDLGHANLNNSNLDDANLTAANLRAATLKNCSLENTSFLRADLAGADLQSAHFVSSNLKDANIKGANLLSADFDVRTVSSRNQPNKPTSPHSRFIHNS
eukprot:TRINITY_DN3589_c0_g1_i1.p1 TRINITY_DN3589_c0_g1~~TRINITY_DN3589_c0_g1_i1.p1  ORF type:complete len:437 (+),score=161.15 TRINITY_DN3589_c0_g1_i1:130-1440(+)